jgi:hypothetical protein
VAPRRRAERTTALPPRLLPPPAAGEPPLPPAGSAALDALWNADGATRALWLRYLGHDAWMAELRALGAAGRRLRS